jgi:hypothetical protein
VSCCLFILIPRCHSVLTLLLSPGLMSLLFVFRQPHCPTPSLSCSFIVILCHGPTVSLSHCLIFHCFAPH